MGSGAHLSFYFSYLLPLFVIIISVFVLDVIPLMINTTTSPNMTTKCNKITLVILCFRVCDQVCNKHTNKYNNRYLYVKSKTIIVISGFLASLWMWIL